MSVGRDLPAKMYGMSCPQRRGAPVAVISNPTPAPPPPIIQHPPVHTIKYEYYPKSAGRTAPQTSVIMSGMQQQQQQHSSPKRHKSILKTHQTKVYPNSSHVLHDLRDIELADRERECVQETSYIRSGDSKSNYIDTIINASSTSRLNDEKKPEESKWSWQRIKSFRRSKK